MATQARFVRYMSPILESLRELGGSARPREVYSAVAAKLEIDDAERDEENRSGSSRLGGVKGSEYLTLMQPN